MIKKIISRPITVIMLFIGILIIGMISLNKLPLELKPNTEYPKLTVSASWNNASPEVMEGQVTSKIESELSGLPNVYKLSSYSGVGSCDISIEYLRDTDMNIAYMNLNEKVFIIKKDLPEDVRKQIFIRKYIPRDLQNSDNLLTYKIYGNMPLYDIYQYVEDEIKNKLTSIGGVSNIEITGASKREIKFLIDREKTTALGIYPRNISNKLRQFGKETNAGIIKKNGQEYNILLYNKFDDLAKLKNIVVAKNGNIPIRISDIAEIRYSLSDNYSINRINGSPTITMSIVKESGANAIEVADKIVAKIEKMKLDFPKSISIELSDDSTKEMRENLDDIKTRALFSLLVITLVLLFFLRDIKTPFIIILTILFSLLITIIIMFFTGYTINVVTISGLALGLGMLVDNSIVVIENIYQYYKKGYSKREAAIIGTKEVVLPIMASTLTTIVVFLPFLYLSGEKRLYWMPLAIAVSVSLVSSLFVSFIFTPTITALFLKRRTNSQKVIQHSDLEIKQTIFHTLLQILIRNKVMVIIFTGLFVYLSYYLFDNYVDKGEIFKWGKQNTVRLYISMPAGSTIEMTDVIIKKFEKKVKEKGNYDKFTTRLGATYAVLNVFYTDEDMQTIKPFEMENTLVSMAQNFAGPFISVYNPLNQSGGYRAGGTTSKSYSNTIIMKGYNYNDLKMHANTLKKFLLENKKISDVDINGTSNWWRSSDLFNFTFQIDRKNLAKFNTTIEYIYYFIMSNISGNYPFKMVIEGKETSYSVKYNDYKTYSVSNLKDLIYKFGRKVFRLNEIGSFEKVPILSEISKEDQAYTRIVKFDYRGSSKNQTQFQQSLEKNYNLPPGYSFSEREYDYMTDEESSEILKILLISIILVFMVTAALFESLLHPFIVILTVPLGLTGVFLIFFFMDETFNREAYMGAILLAGIAVNNSIILINHINDLRKAGLTAMKAIVIGTSQRLRPIIMTSATTIFGILPLIINSDKDASFWYTLSLTTVGGLLASTIFVLLIIPVIYALLERFTVRIHKFVAKLS